MDEEKAKKYLAEESEIIKTGKGFINRIVNEIDIENIETWVSTTKLPMYDGFPFYA